MKRIRAFISVDKIKIRMCEKEQFIKFMMAWAKRAVNYGFRQERLNLLPFQELAFLGGNTLQQNFWIRSRSHSLGRQLGCSGLGSEDTRKIDSTCHILPGGENASWDSLSSPGLWLPLRRKWARRLEWGNDREECGPACRDRVGRLPGNGYPYPISYVFRGSCHIQTLL